MIDVQVVILEFLSHFTRNAVIFAFCYIAFLDTFGCNHHNYYKMSSESDASSTSDSETNLRFSSALVPYEENNVSPFYLEKRTFQYDKYSVTIKQDWRGVGVAAVVWDAANVLGKYLQENPELVKNKQVIELGAGTGLTGIIAGRIGADITLTDRKCALNLLHENVALNIDDTLLGTIHVKELEWGENMDAYNKPFDVILGADIIYIEDTFPQLLATLLKLSNEKTLLLLSAKIRYKRDTDFLEKAREFFIIEDLYYDKTTDVHIYKCKKTKK